MYMIILYLSFKYNHYVTTGNSGKEKNKWAKDNEKNRSNERIGDKDKKKCKTNMAKSDPVSWKEFHD